MYNVKLPRASSIKAHSDESTMNRMETTLDEITNVKYRSNVSQAPPLLLHVTCSHESKFRRQPEDVCG
jgi:hypothetical protein